MHTPLPWGFRKSSGLAEWEVYPLRDGPPDFGDWSDVCSMSDQYDDDNPDEAKDNAALVVRAVNSHDSMLAALEAVVSAYDRPGGYKAVELGRAFKLARAAIALATQVQS